LVFILGYPFTQKNPYTTTVI